MLRQQPDLIPNFVEEAVRFLSPGHAFIRVATRDAVIGDKGDGTELELPAGTHVLLLYGSANHNEAVCPHAEQLDPLGHSKVTSMQALATGYTFALGHTLHERK